MTFVPPQKAYSVEEIRKTYVKAYAPWTKEEDGLLKSAFKNFLENKKTNSQSEADFNKEYSQKLGRKRGAIRSRLTKLLGKVIPQSQKTNKNSVTKQKLVPAAPAVSWVLDLNPEFQEALALMENTTKNVFITGRAGTGKSTLLTYFRNKTKKKVAVLAPTGVAALNVRGQTIHSFFRFKPGITLQNVKRLAPKDGDKSIYQKIEAIVIDEVSMVRSDLLDCVDKSLKLNRGSALPFGGVQMIFIGDLYQLPPVVTGSERGIFKNHYQSQYFFDAQVLKGLDLELVELEKVYRQKDDKFIALLNAIRNNSATAEHLFEINKRCDSGLGTDPKNLTVYLTTTNDLADSINNQELAKLSQRQFTYRGRIRGNFEEKSLPTEKELSVKVGSQVMMLNNDSQERWVNGTIGKIMAIEKHKDKEDEIIVKTREGENLAVIPFTWELFRFSFDRKKNSLVSETIGTFTQYPLKLAWAVTIHKSQGKTFDRVVIDLGKGTFVHGQLYVALSRCTSLSGIVLKQKIEKRHIFMDWRVVKFITQFQYQKSESALPLEQKVRILEDAVKNRLTLPILYLKASDEKSKRMIKPLRVGKMEYQGKEFLGVLAFDEKRQEERVFRVDRILGMER